jgi:hypothetical protein
MAAALGPQLAGIHPTYGLVLHMLSLLKSSMFQCSFFCFLCFETLIF